MKISWLMALATLSVCCPAAALTEPASRDIGSRLFDQEKIRLLFAQAEAEPGTLLALFRFQITSQHPLSFRGNTNLPNGTKVMFLINGKSFHGGIPPCAPHCAFMSYLVVSNGYFETGPVLVDGMPLIPDTYDISVMVGASDQPYEVRLLMGEKGQLLRGPHVFSFSNHHEHRVIFPWNPDPSSDEFVGGLSLHYQEILTITRDGNAVLSE